MNYTLMHKELPVADMELDEVTAAVLKIGQVYHSEHLPVGVGIKNGIVDRTALSTWWLDRSIPASRTGVRRALEVLNIPDTKVLLTRCFGLSLSDQYWIRPIDGNLQWSAVNFFGNAFSEDIGDVLLGKNKKNEAIDFGSPDNTSDGYLKKRWKIIGGRRCLLKSGSNPFMQQPFNEVIASKLAERLGIPHVSYSLTWDGGIPYSICEDFISKDTELVSAWRIMQTKKKGNSTSVYQHYLDCCAQLGVEGIVHAVDQMIVLDFLIANEDRHQNNFGLVRNANTLEWLGAVPIFDSGSALGYDKLASQITAYGNIECKPFKKTHSEQLKLVSSFDWLNLGKLSGFDEEMGEIFDSAGEYMDAGRKKAIMDAFSARLGMLAETSARQSRPVDDLTGDVAADSAERYL